MIVRSAHATPTYSNHLLPPARSGFGFRWRVIRHSALPLVLTLAGVPSTPSLAAFAPFSPASTTAAAAVTVGASIQPTKKDPLAFKVHDAEGITLATFDDWAIHTQSNNDAIVLSTYPNGRQTEYAMVMILASGTRQDMHDLFNAGPAELASMMPTLRQTGATRPAKFGGDEARILDYDGVGAGDMAGKPVQARAVIVRKKDIALIVLGSGTRAGFEEFGRAIEIVAQSVSFKEKPMDPGLIGTWTNAGSTSGGTGAGLVSVSWRTTLSIYPNGSFTEWDQTSGGSSAGDLMTEGGQRGTTVLHGQTLTLHYDNGAVKNFTYELQGGSLLLNGRAFRRQ